MRMASRGQASTQKPQKTQRNMSMSNFARQFFEFRCQATGAAMIWMHSAGQAVAQSMQAVHRGIPVLPLHQPVPAPHSGGKVFSFLGVIHHGQFAGVEQVSSHMAQGHQQALEDLDHVDPLEALDPGPGNNPHLNLSKADGSPQFAVGSEEKALNKILISEPESRFR